MAGSPDAICPLWFKLDLFLDGRLRSVKEVRVIDQSINVQDVLPNTMTDNFLYLTLS